MDAALKAMPIKINSDHSVPGVYEVLDFWTFFTKAKMPRHPMVAKRDFASQNAGWRRQVNFSATGVLGAKNVFSQRCSKIQNARLAAGGRPSPRRPMQAALPASLAAPAPPTVRRVSHRAGAFLAHFPADSAHKKPAKNLLLSANHTDIVSTRTGNPAAAAGPSRLIAPPPHFC
jgi:hypothetical protein